MLDLAEVDPVPEEIGERTLAERGPALAPDPPPDEVLHERRQALKLEVAAEDRGDLLGFVRVC